MAQSNINSNVLQHTNTELLKRLSNEWSARAAQKKAEAMRMALMRGWPVRLSDRKTGREAELIKLAPWGEPLYLVSDNRIAARTIGTWRLRPGGDLGLNLKGANIPIGIWDGGAVRGTHQELTGRVTQVDGATALSAHATHVAGTLVAGGVDTNARGMAYEALLRAHDWNSDDAEMATAAAGGLLVSNHSYGWLSGWYSGTTTNGTANFWYGWEPLSTVEDYKFGYYDDQAVAWDQIADAAPFYLICKSAGNDRGESRTAGTSHNVQDSVSPFGWRLSTRTRNADGNSQGYDCINGAGVAKNVLTVGSVNALPNGYTTASAVVLASSSGNGPTDDGRIKPDVVAQGVGLYSSTSSSNTAYSTLSGTSMASPNAAGSLLLLQERFQQLKGRYMRAASLKGLAIHTADEAGSNEGPDYRFGWGLLNIGKAANLLLEDGQKQHLLEDSLQQGQIRAFRFYSEGGPIRLTLSWTDPVGASPIWPEVLNNANSVLVHDLDLRLVRESDNQTQLPWVLNPTNPANAAVRGDNFRDNVEQIVLSTPTSGWYTVRVAHKGSLQRTQYFTLLATGLGLQSVAPKATFTISHRQPCVGQTVRLEALDSLVGANYSWSISGGSPGSGTSRIMQVSFSQPGSKSIQLIVERNGQFDTVVTNVQVGGSMPPFLETFEQNPHAILIENPDAGSLTWQLDSVAFSRNGSKSLRMPFFSYNLKGHQDFLTMPPINLSGQAGANLSFDHAYTRYPTEFSDTLKVQVSVGCSSNWTTVATFSEGGSGSFATFGAGFNSTSSFIPASNSDWCGNPGFSACKQINLSAYAGQSSVKVRFATVNQYGNNLYLDNIQLTSFYHNSTNFNETICEGNFRLWKGDTLRTSGVYRDTLVNISGGDSILTLQLTVNPIAYSNTAVSICRGTTYLFQGQALSQTGIYRDTLAATSGCDSVIELQLWVKEVSRDSLTASVCQGKSYVFGNKLLNAAGWYADTLQASNGCDSIRVLFLTVKPVSAFQFQASICNGSTYSFGSRTLTMSGTYRDTTISANGCDSIVTLELNVRPSISTSLPVVKCFGTTYLFGGQLLTASGQYSDTLQAANGCDSIVQLTLTVLPAQGSTSSIIRCEGQPYWFNERWLTQSGSYLDTIVGSNGCDSILTLQLFFIPRNITSMNQALCAGDSLAFGGRWIKQAGTYRDTLTNQTGCDSILVLELELLQPSITTLTASICAGSIYVFGGRTLVNPGVYRDTLTAANGCDSIVVLQLQQLSRTFSTLSRVLCQGQQFNFNGQLLNTAGVYRDTLINFQGCDSIITLQIQFYNTPTTFLYATICTGKSHWFNGTWLNQGGIYRDTIGGSFGCDSILVLTLVELSPSSHDLTVNLCAPQSYWFNGSWLTQSGQYTDTLTNASGCDSVVRLTLNILPAVIVNRSMTICAGKSVVFGQQLLTQTGVYTDTLQALSGCDSVVILDLIVQPSIQTNLQASICAGSGYQFGNRFLQQSGQYFDTLFAQNGCDSLVSLVLTLLQPAQTTLTQTLCSGQSISFNGQLIQTSGIYRDTLVAGNGCDSLVTLQVVVQQPQFVNLSAGICPGGNYIFGNQVIQQAGTYRDTLVGINGCDSIITLNLALKQPAFTQIQDSVCLGKTYLFGNQSLTQAGTYRDTLAAANGCDSIITLTLSTKNGVFTNQLIQVCFGDSVFIDGAWRKTNQSVFLNLTAANGCDSIHAINILFRTPVIRNISRSICQGQSFNFNGTLLTQSGSYTDTLLNIHGCDSIVNLSLSVNANPAKPTISRMGNNLISSSASGNQWYETSIGIIPGATSSTFTPSQPNGGRYWVVVTNGFGCSSAPSDTFAFIGTGLVGNMEVMKSSFFPNPTTGTIHLSHQAPEGEPVIWTISDLSGRTLQTLWQTVGNGELQAQFTELPALAQGTYLIEVRNRSYRKVEKLILLR